jgi:hypothetical protein
MNFKPGAWSGNQRENASLLQLQGQWAGLTLARISSAVPEIAPLLLTLIGSR